MDAVKKVNWQQYPLVENVPFAVIFSREQAHCTLSFSVVPFPQGTQIALCPIKSSYSMIGAIEFRFQDQT